MGVSSGYRIKRISRSEAEYALHSFNIFILQYYDRPMKNSTVAATQNMDMRYI